MDMSELTVPNSRLKAISQFSAIKDGRSHTCTFFHLPTLHQVNRKSSCLRPFRSPSAFSLVELALALGIVSFAFVGIFGLIPTGLNTFHQAMDTSIGSQIAQRVISDVQQTDFDKLVQSGSAQPSLLPFTYSNTRYFDNQGNEVVPANPGSLNTQEQLKIVYWVNTVVTPAPKIPTAANYTCLKTVTIQVANNPGNQSPLTDTTTKLWTNGVLPISTYSAQVARNQ